MFADELARLYREVRVVSENFSDPDMGSLVEELRGRLNINTTRLFLEGYVKGTNIDNRR